MSKHISKEQKLQNYLDEIKSRTNKGNVDLVLPLMDWTINKIDLIVLADQKRVAFKEARAERKPLPSPLLVSRGEIWEANLGYNIGSEQNECRPVLIIQNEGSNKRSPNTIIAPISDLSNRLKYRGQTTEEEIIEQVRSKLRDTEVLLPRDCVKTGDTALLYPSILLCQNIRELSKERLRFKITTIDDTYWNAVNTAISYSLGLA